MTEARYILLTACVGLAGIVAVYVASRRIRGIHERHFVLRWAPWFWGYIIIGGYILGHYLPRIPYLPIYFIGVASLLLWWTRKQTAIRREEESQRKNSS